MFTGHAQSYLQPEDTIRVMSYNTRNCRGMDNIVDYKRIADVINDAAPDVIALQELDSATVRSKGVDVLAQLSNLTEMYPVYGASIPYDGGKYGVGILSKEKPVSQKRISLPGREESRSLLIVEFKNYIFCCTHLSLTQEDRLASVSIINQTVKDFNKPVFMAGDINATPESPVLTALKENWVILSNPEQLTIPSNKPRQTIDYIFGYISKGYVYSVPQACLFSTLASDHLPIMAKVLIK
jgi:endonuclease/exonuclease/phosphatase family metal-dependent hydrolase